MYYAKHKHISYSYDLNSQAKRQCLQQNTLTAMKTAKIQTQHKQSLRRQKIKICDNYFIFNQYITIAYAVASHISMRVFPAKMNPG